MSGGERQRLFLVLALLNQPRLVILDELTQGLDPAARREVWSAVVQLRETATTVLLVTHELDEAELLCDQVIAMRAGRVLDQGAPAELVARHAREVTVRFGLVTTDMTSTANTLQALNRLPGVTGVTRDRADVVIRGTREAIAHVGAWLVRTGRPVPADLRVEIPDLEAALLTLLDNDQTDHPTRWEQRHEHLHRRHQRSQRPWPSRPHVVGTPQRPAGCSPPSCGC